jgi:hypothetical protein
LACVFRYIVAIIPNFYGFLNAMGVPASLGVVHFYYFAYPIGIVLSMGVFWFTNYFSHPSVYFDIKEWHEPKDYIRPEEDSEVFIERQDIEYILPLMKSGRIMTLEVRKLCKFKLSKTDPILTSSRLQI